MALANVDLYDNGRSRE